MPILGQNIYRSPFVELILKPCFEQSGPDEWKPFLNLCKGVRAKILYDADFSILLLPSDNESLLSEMQIGSHRLRFRDKAF